MATTKKTLSYSGRKVDVLAFNGEFSDMQFVLDQAIHNKVMPSGGVCAGIQKLAQRWLIEFFTPLGSMPYLPYRGSSFLNSVRRGYIRTELDASMNFAYAKDQVADNLRAEDSTGGYPDDEKYADAELLGISVVQGSKLTLSVQINSLAGITRVFVVPVAVVPAR